MWLMFVVCNQCDKNKIYLILSYLYNAVVVNAIPAKVQQNTVYVRTVNLL